MVTLEGQSGSSESIDFFPPQQGAIELSDRTVVTVLAVVDRDVDILAQMQDAFNNFIDSGQGWALLIGVFVGYLFRSFTSY